MKNLLKLFALLMVMIMMTGCMSSVPAGEVGVKFNNYGSSKGVDAQAVGPGRYWLSWNEQLFTFPTFTQTYVFEKNGDSKTDESISFGTVEGLTINADMGVTYNIDPTKVTTLFQTYRKGIDEITNVFVRNMIRDSLVREASKVGVETVYGLGKADLIQKVQDDVTRQVAPLGIEIQKVYWIGDLRLPQKVIDSINSKIQATQLSQQRNNEIAQSEAEAKKLEAQAEGQAQAKLKLAQAEATSIKLQGEALANNPGVKELRAIEKWDGKLPTVNSGAVPFINIGATK